MLVGTDVLPQPNFVLLESGVDDDYLSQQKWRKPDE